MKRIGLLGGMSWESIAEYYRRLNELVRRRLDRLHSARVLLDSVDLAATEALQAEGHWEDAGVLLAERAYALEAGGAEVIALCTNTMHMVVSAVESAVQVVPAQDDRAAVHRIIYDELVQCVISEESRQTYREVVRRLVAHGAQG